MIRYFALFFVAISLAVPSFAEESHIGKPSGLAVGKASVSATVEAIDYKTRFVTLKKDNGEQVSFKVGEIAHNFDKVKKGDRVTFEYMEALALDVRKAEGDLSAEAEVTIERAPKGAQPKGVISEAVTLKALVESIDYDKRMVTLKGPQGNMLTLKVGEQAKRFGEVKKGDHVVVQYTEALGISVTSPRG